MEGMVLACFLLLELLILGEEMVVAPFLALFSPPVPHMGTRKRGKRKKTLKDQSRQGFAKDTQLLLDTFRS